MIDREQAYQDLLMQRAQLEYNQTIMDISLKVPDMAAEIKKIQDELSGPGGFLERQVTLTADTTSFANLQKYLDEYQYDLSNNIDTTGVKTKITDELKTLGDDGAIVGQDIINSITKRLDGDQTITDAVRKTVYAAQNKAIEDLNKVNYDIVQDQINLVQMGANLETLAKGAGDLGINIGGMGGMISANQAQIGATQKMIDTSSATVSDTAKMPRKPTTPCNQLMTNQRRLSLTPKQQTRMPMVCWLN